MKRLLLSLLLPMLLVSCNDIRGRLTTKGLNLSEGRIGAGTHNAEIKFSSSKKIKLKVGDRKFKFRIPKEVQVPRDNGEIFISKEDSNQPYDIAGAVSTKVERGNSVRDWEQCFYDRAYRVCRNQGGRQVCEVRYRRHYGSQQVVYYVRDVKKKLSLSFLNGSDSAGQFAGKSLNRQKVYEYRGYCR